MKNTLCALVVSMAVIIPGTVASSAWTQFVSHTAPVAVPEGNAPAMNLVGTGAGTRPYAVVQDSGKSKTTVLLNKFISQGSVSPDVNKKRIFKLCHDGAAGTGFAGIINAAWENSNKGNDTRGMPSGCMQCLAQGWGTDESSPGFYLPCGCSNVCVDVSGNTRGNWARRGINQQDGTNSAIEGLTQFPSTAATGPLSNCSAYLANDIVYACSGVARYHFVLWISLIAAIAAIYFAYFMSYMQLDMDSLLFEPIPKKDQ